MVAECGARYPKLLLQLTDRQPLFPGFDKIDLVGVIAAIAGILVLWGCERLDPGEAK